MSGRFGVPRCEATIDAMQVRLLAWSAWKHGGALADGYPTRSVLHESWAPPQPGRLGGMQVARGRGDARERALDRLICRLCVRLQDTLVVVYLMRASPAEQCERLGCQASTVRARVVEAKRILAAWLAE